MAVLKDFGKSENDSGKWFPFGEEVPAPFEVRVRRIPYDVATRISKRYGREQMVVVDGVRRPVIERNLDETTKWLIDQAAWSWVDARGLQVEVADDEGAKLWSSLLKDTITPGQVIDLSGNVLTHEVKVRVLTQIRPFAIMTDAETLKKDRVDLATFLVLKAAQLQAEGARQDEEALGNS